METAVAFEYCHPRTVLESAAKLGTNHLQVSDRAITWHLYFADGQLVYASNSADPFERLERYLRSLADSLPALTKDVRDDMRARFAEVNGDSVSPTTGLCNDYGAIVWAVGELYVDAITAGELANKITAEVMEGYIQLPEANYQIKHQALKQLPSFCTLPISSLVERVEERLNVWRSLAPHLLSPYQRPYLASKRLARTRLKERRVQQLSKLLVGFNFRQLGMIVGQDELLFAQRLYPLIADQIILLRSPLAPFDKLPYPIDTSEHNIFQDPALLDIDAPKPDDDSEEPEQTVLQIGPLAAAEPSEDTLGMDDTPQASWNIACVDPGEVLVNAIRPLIEGTEVSLEQVTDPSQALSVFAKHPPDLIFLQANMPMVDGYELCSLMRKSPSLKSKPIVLMLPKKGLLDGARVRMAGATHALNSQYTSKDLLGVIFRYLSS